MKEMRKQHRYTKTQFHSPRLKIILAAACMMLFGCEENFEDEIDDVAALEESQQSILNGDKVGDDIGLVSIYSEAYNYDTKKYEGSLCTGTLLQNRWVLTAAHCTMGVKWGTYRVYQGAEFGSGPEARVNHVIRHNKYDAALLWLDSPLSDPIVTPLYTKPVANLNGKTLKCYGYGTYDLGKDIDGKLRTAQLEVRAEKRKDFDILEDPNDEIFIETQLVSYKNGRDQIQWTGDSGGPCIYSENNVQYAVSVLNACYPTLDAKGNVTDVTECLLTSTEAISKWVYENVGIGYDWDPDYYMARYPKLAVAINFDYARAYDHWYKYGNVEGRDSSPSFSVSEYLALNPDVANYFGSTNFKSAFSHFYNNGIYEGRRASYAFDVKYYLSHNSDLRSRFGSTDYKTAANHFALHGLYERRSSSPVFNAAWYLDHNSDLKRAFGSKGYLAALMHYQTYGLNEGRQAHPDFSPRAYLARYSDLRNAFGTNYKLATLHYLLYGIAEGRNGRP